MKEEKEEKMQNIVILDEGIEMDGLISPQSVCCGSALMPLQD